MGVFLLKYTDPTGHYVVDSDDGEIAPPIPKEDNGDVDVTEWLVWQMKWNAQSEEVESLYAQHTLTRPEYQPMTPVDKLQ